MNDILYKYKGCNVKIVSQTLDSDDVVVRVVDLYAPHGRFFTVSKSQLKRV